MKYPNWKAATTAAAILLAVGSAIVADNAHRIAEQGSSEYRDEYRDNIERESITGYRIQRASIDDQILYRPVESIRWAEFGAPSEVAVENTPEADVETQQK